MPTATEHTDEEESRDADRANATRAAKSMRGEPAKLWTPLFILLIAATLCCFMAGQGLNSGTSVYLARIGSGAALAGVLATVFSAAAAAARIVCGPLIDRTGRYPTLIGGMVLITVGILVPALVYDPTVFFICRIAQGIGFSAATTAAATAAADVLPKSRLGEGIGYYGLGQALAMSMGPAVALFLVGTDPAENLYLGLAFIAGIGLLLALVCRYEKHPEKLPATSAFRLNAERKNAAEREANAQGNQTDAAPVKKTSPFSLSELFEGRALPGALPMLVLTPAFGFGIFFIGLYGTSLGIVNPGLFYTISAVSMVAVRLKSRSFMDRVAPIKVFSVAIACGLGAFLLLQAAPMTELAYYAAGLIYGVSLGVSMPLNQAVAVKNTPVERWGAANALYLLACDVGVGIGSAVWGFVNETWGFSVALWCVMGCIAAAFVVAKLVYPKEG